MTIPIQPSLEPEIEYPDSDGQRMSDNTLQFRWIVTVQGNLDALYRDRDDVFVAGDLLWYPVEGHPTIRSAPDAMVVFGRPKEERGSYQQWREDGIAPQVVFEIQSPGNRPEELDRKLEFYERYGVQEYYLYDPDSNHLCGWVRAGRVLQPIPVRHGWVSPLLGIRFDLSGDELVIYRPDGKPFLTFKEIVAQQEATQQLADLERRAREQTERRADQAERRADQERRAREEAQRLADNERLEKAEMLRRMEQERRGREEAERRADHERQDKEAALCRAERLAEQLRKMGIDPGL